MISLYDKPRPCQFVETAITLNFLYDTVKYDNNLVDKKGGNQMMFRKFEPIMNSQNPSRCFP